VLKGFDMAVLVIRYQVESFDTWKAVFDEQTAIRRAHGSRQERVFRHVVNTNEVLIYLEWDDGERAWLFARSDDLRESMVRAGVIDHPDVWILKEVDRTAF
jgi:hypothetical protein